MTFKSVRCRYPLPRMKPVVMTSKWELHSGSHFSLAVWSKFD